MILFYSITANKMSTYRNKNLDDLWSAEPIFMFSLHLLFEDK